MSEMKALETSLKQDDIARRLSTAVDTLLLAGCHPLKIRAAAVAHLAGCSAGSIYDRWPSMDCLVLSALGSRFKRFSEVFDNGLDCKTVDMGGES